VKSGFSSSLGTTILRSPKLLAFYVIVDDPLFVPGYLLQKRLLLVLFEQQIVCIQALLQVPVAQFVRYSHIHSTYISSISEVRHNASVQQEFLGFL